MAMRLVAEVHVRRVRIQVEALHLDAAALQLNGRHQPNRASTDYQRLRFGFMFLWAASHAPINHNDKHSPKALRGQACIGV